jgi:hypothetical protein
MIMGASEHQIIEELDLFFLPPYVSSDDEVVRIYEFAIIRGCVEVY